MQILTENTKKYAAMRFLYILEAAVEYFFSLAVGTIYLAKLTAYIGISDGVTGILSAFVSLGCSFQLFALFLANKRNRKRWITIGHISSQFMFVLLYFIPVIQVSKTVKTVLFIGMLLFAYVIHNAINSPKINWYMSFVPLNKRGRFTANKEIVSLLSGIVVSYALGRLMDHYEACGNMRMAFIIGGCALTVLLLLHSAILFMTEKPQEQPNQVKFSIKGLFREKGLLKIVLIFTLWYIANYAVVSYSGTYQTKELEFSTTFASLIIIVGSLLRAIFSKPFGKYADKRSFRSLLVICFGLEALSFGVYACTVPSNGKVFYFLFYCLHCLGMAGINSAMLNLLYDYVKAENLTGAYALVQAIAGCAGFLITLLFSPFVEYVQKNGNRVFGLPLYAQQALAIFSLIITLGILIYMQIAFKKKPKTEREQSSNSKVTTSHTDAE